MTKEQKERILALCKEHIDEHGSVRVGWAAKEIIGSPQQNHIKDKIAAKLIETGEYVKEPSRKFELDWNVRKNPEYKSESWTTRKPVLFEFLKGGITAIFSIVVSVLLSVLIISKSEKGEETEIKTEKQTMQKQTSNTPTKDSSSLKNNLVDSTK